MMTTMRLFCAFMLSLAAMQPHVAQHLLDALNEGVQEPTLPVTATFKDTRIINVQSNETPAEGVLHFVIAHRFGTLNSGIYELWGLDNAQMRMALDYGITDRLALGVARNTYQKTFEANVKVRLLRQSTGPKAFPISVTWYSVAMANGLQVSADAQPYPFSRRLSYVHQAVMARKMNNKLSLALVPSFVHRNFVEESGDAHDLFLMGIGGRYKLRPRLSLNGEYHHFLTPTFGDAFSPSLSLGVDIETGGHVFQLHVTNARGMFERSFLAEPAGSWVTGDLYFGFNLSRVFTVKS
ncbi:MAG: DUF5777 family beta-barrel protein [Bacteroidota bacterium]|nr:DUF5777 family beta-barrel protein [Bacteroidota bacterium]